MLRNTGYYNFVGDEKSNWNIFKKVQGKQARRCARIPSNSYWSPSWWSPGNWWNFYQLWNFTIRRARGLESTYWTRNFIFIWSFCWSHRINSYLLHMQKFFKGIDALQDLISYLFYAILRHSNLFGIYHYLSLVKRLYRSASMNSKK